MCQMVIERLFGDAGEAIGRSGADVTLAGGAAGGSAAGESVASPRAGGRGAATGPLVLLSSRGAAGGTTPANRSTCGGDRHGPGGLLGVAAAGISGAAAFSSADSACGLGTTSGSSGQSVYYYGDRRRCAEGCKILRQAILLGVASGSVLGLVCSGFSFSHPSSLAKAGWSSLSRRSLLPFVEDILFADPLRCVAVEGSMGLCGRLCGVCHTFLPPPLK